MGGAAIFHNTPLGVTRLLADRMGRLCGLTICTEHQGEIATGVAGPLSPDALPGKPALRVLDETRRQLDLYFAGHLTEFHLPVALAGTAFQRAVWAGLRGISFGQTLSYAELALRIGQPRKARAVGHANARNPIWLIVPCHRVIRTGGSLGGYAGGLAVKQWLLDHEDAVNQRSLFPLDS